MATCPKCLREAWQTRCWKGGDLSPDQCTNRGGRDCGIAAAGGAAAIRAERAREAEMTHPQLVESLYAERDAARSELSDVLAERDGLQSMLTQQGREHASDRARIAAFIRAQLDITHRTTPQADALKKVLAFVEGQ